jgi:hypothetical protein
VPLDKAGQDAFGGLLRWFWPWGYGDGGPLGQLTPGGGSPVAGFFLAATTFLVLVLAALAAAGLWVPAARWRALAVGAPIGLGVAWAWVHRDWPARMKTGGFGGATGGALVGAWLGAHATAGPPALLTVIVGAAAVANLFLILLDISGARSRRRPLAPPFLVDSVREGVRA